MAQQALTNRKAKLEQMVAIDDDREKAVLIAKFDHEMALVKEAIKTGYRDYPLLDTKMVLTDDGEKPILFRRPAHNEKAVTDWLNFTIHKSTFDSRKREKLQGYRHLAIDNCLVTNSDYVYACGEVIQDIFGFGIECKMKSGINYYNEAYKLENGCGTICIGGQNDTIMITITGVGCTLGKYGWEEDLHAWLNLFAHRPKITY
jgi:phage replication initiation protein